MVNGDAPLEGGESSPLPGAAPQSGAALEVAPSRGQLARQAAVAAGAAFLPQGYPLWAIPVFGGTPTLTAASAEELDKKIDVWVAQQVDAAVPVPGLVVSWVRGGFTDNGSEGLSEVDLRPVMANGVVWRPGTEMIFGTTRNEAIEALRAAVAEEARLDNPATPQPGR